MDEEKENVEVTDEKVTQEINNEEIIENEELGEFTDNSNTSKEEVEEPKQEKLYTKEEFDAEVERISKDRERRAYNKATRERRKEFEEYSDIVDTLMVGMNKKDVSELKASLKDFYSEQGIEFPARKKLTEREERILAKADAEEIIESGEDEVNKIANEIYNKPESQRSLREKIIFDTLGNHAMEVKARKSLEDNGIDTSILQDNKFKNFASKFNSMTPLSEVYEVNSKLNEKSEEKVVERPKSTGSAKTVKNTNEIKEFYTPEEVRKFTMKDLDDPNLMKAIENSMKKWK